MAFIYGLDDKRQLTVRLSHDGFRYRALQGKSVVYANSRGMYNARGWCMLDINLAAEMPHLHALCERLQATVSIYYNRSARRVDFLFRHSVSGDKILKMCFEPGMPRGLRDDPDMHI